MNGNRISSTFLWPTVPLAIGLAVFVTKKSPPLGLFLDAVFLSVGVLLLVHAALIRRVQEKVKQDQKPSPGYEESLLKEDDIQPTRFGVALIVAALAGLLCLIPTATGQQNAPPPDQVQSLIQLLGKTESDLNECAKSKGCKPGDEAAAARMEEVLQTLQGIVDNLPSHGTPPSTPPNGTSSWGTILVVALVLAIGAIIWLTVKSSPSKTPLAITAALVGAIIKGAKLLPQPGGDFYWYSVFVLLVIGGLVVLIATVRWAWKGDGAGPVVPVAGPAPVAAVPPVAPAMAPGIGAPQPAEGFWSRLLDFLFKKPPERPDSDSPMVVGFSILLLAFAMAYLGKAHEQTQTHVSTCPTCPAVPNLVLSKGRDWSPVRGFGEKKDAAITSDLGQFQRELESEKLTDADLLLLLGSTDCTPISDPESGVATNQALAGKRASFVKAQASKFGLASLPTILPGAVQQAETCGKALDQRAVYPLLFRPETPK